MKKMYSLIASLVLLAAAATTQAGIVYSYTFTGDSGAIVNGTFTGTASGNLITNLSDISVFFNGQALNGNGSLFNAHYTTNGTWISGGAVASFDGSENNFLFIDSDFPSYQNYTNYFYSIAHLPQSYATSPGFTQGTYSFSALTSSNWSVTAVTSSVAEPSSILLFGLGLLGLVAVRKRVAR